MKYCPYCGASLLDGAASFCTECGRPIPQATALSSADRYKNDDAKKEKRKRRKKAIRGSEIPQKESTLPENTPDDGYDGYYDDILPADLSRHREGIDKMLIRKIAAIGIGVVLVIGLCVAALYLL